MGKIKLTQDELYQFFLDHNLTVKRLGELIGLSDSAMSSAFKHHKVNGKPHYFPLAKLQFINDALSVLSGEIADRLVSFNPENNRARHSVRVFDRACVEQFRRVGEYFNLTALVGRILGWNKAKKQNIICIPASKVYGHITQEDVNRINAELRLVAAAIANFKLVAEEGISSNENAKHLKASTKRKTMECRCEAPKYGWDDISIGLPERSRMLRQQWPNGMLLFRVNGGYTVEGDDAHTVHKLMPDVQPYTNPESGITTAYMSEEQMTQVLSKIIAKGRRVMITDMYKE